MAVSSIANKMAMIIIVTILMIQSVSSSCDDEAASGAYTRQVAEVVSKLQQSVPYTGTFKDTRTSNEGYVTGSASCTTVKNDAKAAIDDCLTCLGWASADLTTGECMGKMSGASTGTTSFGLDGACTMSFGPAAK